MPFYFNGGCDFTVIILFALLPLKITYGMRIALIFLLIIEII